MNADSASSAGSGPAANQRKERGAIAAQVSLNPSAIIEGTDQSFTNVEERLTLVSKACDTCRSRKQKCDEQRPKCGLCQRMKIECRYREPLPTKYVLFTHPQIFILYAVYV